MTTWGEACLLRCWTDTLEAGFVIRFACPVGDGPIILEQIAGRALRVPTRESLS